VEGLTLSNWLRRARIEKAATLIATGRCNVSEAALEVGYQSFSHFSRAFAEEKGVPPSQWVRRLSGV
jgi:AraC-like DNA-binding protein